MRVWSWILGLGLALATPAAAQSDVLARADTAGARVRRMLDDARADRDIVRVRCLNDALLQIEMHRRGIRERTDALDAARDDHDHERAAREREVLEVLAQRVGVLESEAVQCIGADLYAMANARVAVADGPQVELLARTRLADASALADEFREVSPSGDRLARADGVDGADDVSDGEAGDGRILVYRASLRMAVFEVEPRQQAILAIVEALDGYLDERTDDRIVVRVPAPRFEAALAQIGALGQVLDRHVRVRDVGREHRDLRIRLDNAQRTRDRLLAVLARAEEVEDILAVERELERVTLEVERLQAELRALDLRIAMSVIEVSLSAAVREGVAQGDGLALPVPWLDDLGVGRLLDLREEE
ncbi:MAG: DUF4349 domain-containing protein [Sandaracinaceae bacterium]